MALTRPRIMIPQNLDSVPSNLYEQVYNKFYPVNPPQDGVKYDAERESEIIFQISVPPNEYVDMTKAAFSVNVQRTIDCVQTPAVPYAGPGAVPVGDSDQARLEVEKAFVNFFILGRKSTRLQSVQYRWGPWCVSRSEEACNTGSLKLDQNSDSTLAPVYNNLKCMLSKGHYDPEEDEIHQLYGAGCSFHKQRQGFNVRYSSNNVAGTVTIDNGASCMRIPMSLVSEMARCPSLIPLGFFSSVSVNAYSLRVTLPRITAFDASSNPNGVVYLPSGNANLRNHPTLSQLKLASAIDAPADGYYNPHIYLPTVRNLSMETQEVFDALYSKRVDQTVGGVTVPLSLRLNSLGYRLFGVYSLRAGQAQYQFDLPTVDSSVRGVAWAIFRTDAFAKHITDDGNRVCPDQATLAGTTDADAIEGTGFAECFSNGQLRLTELEVMVGTRDLTKGCIRDYRASDCNVQEWLALGERRSGACASALPYWKELVRNDGDQSDYRKSSQWGVPKCKDQATQLTQVAGDVQGIGATKVAAGCYNAQYGFISLENTNHQGYDLDDATVACGMNLNNVGSIRVRMGFSNCDSSNPLGLSAGPNTSDYRIVFMAPYDDIIEVSPAGLQKIAQEVLSF